MKKTLLATLSFSLLLFFYSCQTNTIEPVQNSADKSELNKSAGNIGINIVLNTAVTDKILNNLKTYGKVMDVIPEINGVRLLGRESVIPNIQALKFVKGANPDAERDAPPIDAVPVPNFSAGLSTWDLDVINVTDYWFDNRQVDQDGSGVYVLILDTGLLDNWRQYFPQERIASDLAKSFSGGGAMGLGAIAEQPNKWEHDQDSHGTHVTSTVLGYKFFSTPINGVAPMATIVPVKVLNQNGSGWSSVIAEGILYAAYVKDNTSAPVVVNMSLGGSRLDVMEKAAIDYAIDHGVIIVASAGNRGTAGMGYPGGYAPVISVAASGWVGEWLTDNWWYANVPDPGDADNYYIADFSSRAIGDQELDVAAPGSWVLGPYQLNSSGRTSYYFLGGTSMASPHVAGIVALMLQKNPALTRDQVENTLKDTALPLPPGTRTIYDNGTPSLVSWGDNATGAGIVDAEAALNAL